MEKPEYWPDRRDGVRALDGGTAEGADVPTPELLSNEESDEPDT